jgi:hypothetical protein
MDEQGGGMSISTFVTESGCQAPLNEVINVYDSNPAARQKRCTLIGRRAG